MHGRDGADPADFEPRCRKCHIAYDRPKAKQGSRSDSRVSQYKGVGRVRKGDARRWFARIAVDGPSVIIGYFDTEEDAARAYDAAALEAWGEYAFLNFPVTASGS